MQVTTNTTHIRTDIHQLLQKHGAQCAFLGTLRTGRCAMLP